MQNWNWELISATVAIIVAVLSGVWFICGKIFRLGRITQRFEDVDTRTRNANCDSHSKDIKEIKNKDCKKKSKKFVKEQEKTDNKVLIVFQKVRKYTK